VKQSSARTLVPPGGTSAPGILSATENAFMADKFDPAPTDKHADTPKERAAADKKADDELKRV